MPILEVNGHQMYYEIHGADSAPKAVCMGGGALFVMEEPRTVLDTYSRTTRC